MEFTYVDLLNKIRSKNNFSFARYGDGEWNAILGTNKKANCDHHSYFPDMGRELGQIIKSNPKYILGMQPLAQKVMGGKINDFITSNGVKIDWCDADILHKASIRGELGRFFEALNERDVIFIGPSKLRNIGKYIDCRFMFLIPETDCWLKNKEIESILCTELNKREDQVILYCASMMTEVLIDRIYQKFRDTQTQIDCGSVFDPYLGYNSRRYHKNLPLENKRIDTRPL